MKIIVTAGPTREPIDPVRFISNRASGKMGYALARSALKHGHEVVLISGPVSIEAPEHAKLIRVISGKEMLDAVRKYLGWCNVLIMAAAVVDCRPEHISSHKIKKSQMPPSLDLKPVPDILKTLSALKGDRIFVGFAAETENIVESARQKLIDKGLDLIVANNVEKTDSGFEVDTNRVTLISSSTSTEALPLMLKDDIAEQLIKWIENFSRNSSRK